MEHLDHLTPSYAIAFLIQKQLGKELPKKVDHTKMFLKVIQAPNTNFDKTWLQKVLKKVWASCSQLLLSSADAPLGQWLRTFEFNHLK